MNAVEPMNAVELDGPAGPRLKLGISACLLGQEVRYDGGHKRNAFLTDQLGRFVEWVPVCPELEAGMGVPRESVQLVQIGGATHMIATHSGRDWTAEMSGYARRRVSELGGEDLCGYVLKKDSPSCGMERVKLYGAAGQAPERKGRGLFAAALLERFPSLPVEEEGRLQDPLLRENFIERVFAWRRLRDFFQARWRVAGLVEFHAAHKLQLMAHSAAGATALGRVVATAQRHPREALRAAYEQGFMELLRRPATRRRHVNVLQHMLGSFKKDLRPEARQDLAAVIEEYRLERVPLIVPVTLLRHYVRLQGPAWLRKQTYLEPHPRELKVRNQV